MDERIRQIVHQEIFSLRKSLILSLDQLSVDKLIKKKNPYLLAAMTNSPIEFIRECIQAHFCSSCETKFGKLFENIAITICGKNTKSPSEGIDLDIERNGYRLLISVKSGPSWGNSQSTAKQKSSFEKAKRVVSQNDKNLKIKSMMGICYTNGTTTENIKHADVQICGQNFWHLISGDKNLYRDLVTEMRHGTEEFRQELDHKISETSERLLGDLNKRYKDGDMWQNLTKDCCANFHQDDKWMNEFMGDRNNDV